MCQLQLWGEGKSSLRRIITIGFELGLPSVTACATSESILFRDGILPEHEERFPKVENLLRPVASTNAASHPKREVFAAEFYFRRLYCV